MAAGLRLVDAETLEVYIDDLGILRIHHDGFAEVGGGNDTNDVESFVVLVLDTGCRVLDYGTEELQVIDTGCLQRFNEIVPHQGVGLDHGTGAQVPGRRGLS